MDTQKFRTDPDLALEPTRRRAYFLEHLEAPRVPAGARTTVTPYDTTPLFAPAARAATSFLWPLFLYSLTLALSIAAAALMITAENAVNAVIGFLATLAASVLLIAMSAVLGEEIVFQLSAVMPLLLMRARDRWAWLRRILRALAGGSLTASVGPY